MKKGKGLSIALIATMVMSMIFGVFTATNVFAEEYPEMVCCDAHWENHVLVTGTGGNSAQVRFYDIIGAGSLISSYDDQFPFGYFAEPPERGVFYYYDYGTNSYNRCTTLSPTCSHESTTYHAAAAGADCQTNGNVEYWTCAGCNQNFEDEACTTPIANIYVGETGSHNMEMTSDGKQHWEACTITGCDHAGEKADHQFGSDEKDLSFYTCSVCGYEKLDSYKEKANTTLNDIAAAAKRDILGYTLEENVSAQFLEAVESAKTAGNTAINNAAGIAAVSQELTNAQAAIQNEIDGAFTASKNETTEVLNTGYTNYAELISSADVPELVKEAALTDLAKIHETGKAAIANGEVVNDVTAAFLNSANGLNEVYYRIAGFKSHDILEGAASTMVQNSDDAVSIRVDALVENFLGVKVNGVLVAPENYSLASGSTIINFNKDFLNTLGAGEHKVEMLWKDGSANTTLTIEAKAEAPQGEVIQGEAPKTGDTTNMTLWAILTAVAVLTGVGATLLTEKERKEIKKSNLKIK